eukprot:m.470870 g.470870  ORF g.470870 m.470870 type:complete len:901 (+) comp21656_c3_seq1:249-2951(+)
MLRSTSFRAALLLSAHCILEVACRTAPAHANTSGQVHISTDPPSPCLQFGSQMSNNHQNVSVYRRFVPQAPIGPSHKAFGRQHKLDRKMKLLVLVRPPPDTESDGYKRFIRSCEVNRLQYQVLPEQLVLGSRGLVAVLQKKQEDNVAILWVEEPHDTIMLAEETEIIQTFQSLAVSDVNKTKLDRDLNASRTSPYSKILLTGMRICKEFCGGTFEWPEVVDGVKFGTRFVDPTMMLGHIDSFVELATAVPPPEVAQEDLLAKVIKVTPMQHVLTLYGNNESKKNLELTVDNRNTMLQSLHGFANDFIDEEFVMKFTYRGKNDTRLFTNFASTFPVAVHGAGNTDLLDHIGDYAPLQWTPSTGCTSCIANAPCTPSESDLAAGRVPHLLVVFHIEFASPFLDYVLEAFAQQDYPKSKMTLRFIVSDSPSATMYAATCQSWLDNLTTPYAGATVAMGNHSDAVLNASRDVLTATVVNNNVTVPAFDFAFFLSSNAFLNDSAVLNLLVHENRTALAPKLTRTGKYFSNFWGSTIGGQFAQCYDDDSDCLGYVKKKLCTEGDYVDWMKTNCARSCGHCTGPKKSPMEVSYKRSFDYFAIVERQRVGVWSAPLVNSALLINKRGLQSILEGYTKDITSNTFNKSDFQAMHAWSFSIKVAQWIRQNNDRLFVTNVLSNAGSLIDPDAYRHNSPHPELYTLPGNEPLWKRRYISENYTGEPEKEWAAPHCWDIYQFPLFNELFCDHLIEESEHYGKWSGSSAYDDRLKGGYEPVPTQDIHFNQFGWQDAWKSILRTFVAPVANGIFTGYSLRGQETLDFIVRYKGDGEGQSSLRPHHDASTVSVTVALNTRGVDFEGGGTHYIRQNCTVYNPKGMAVLHPGILTHQHEGLETTAGVRYIIVSFVDQR